MKQRYAFIRAFPRTLYNLKLLAAFRGESIVRTLDRLIIEACHHVGLSPKEEEESRSND